MGSVMRGLIQNERVTRGYESSKNILNDIRVAVGRVFEIKMAINHFKQLLL